MTEGGVNIQKKATIIWNIANALFGHFKPREYGLVVLPMTVVKRFSESYNEEAGAHFTSRDIIYLMTDILRSNADLTHAGNVTIYDMATGASQMLSCMEERIHDLNYCIPTRPSASTGSGSRRPWKRRRRWANWGDLLPVFPRSATDSSSSC